MSKKNKKNPPARTKQITQETIPPHELSIEKYEAHAGPLPDPRTLEYYNKIVPGAAERILTMAEKNTDHYCQMDRDYLAAQKKLAELDHQQKATGQKYALWTSLAMAGLSFYALKSGHPGVSGAVGTSTIIALVTVFVTGRSKTPEGKKNNGET